MPFGPTGAPACYQKHTADLIDNIRNNAAKIVDDTLVFAEDLEKELENFEKYLITCLFRDNVLKPAKTLFLWDSVKFGGRLINTQGVMRPLTKHLNNILNFVDPKGDIHLIRSLLGMAQWISPWVPGLSSLLQPFTELTKKNAPESAFFSQFRSLKCRLRSV